MNQAVTINELQKKCECLNGRISLHSTKANGSRVDFDYSISQELVCLFDTKYQFYYEYMFDIDCSLIPDSILNVPFVMNIMPLIWISNSVLQVKVLDRQFYDCLENIKQGFQKVYPKVNFSGKLLVDKLEDNSYLTYGKSTIFFTGGVDATASLINNLSKEPQPFYILGADVRLEDTDNIKAAERDVSNNAEKFGLPCKFIRSSVRFFYDGVKLTDVYEKQLKDSWWHGAQHSIGMLSLMAPYAYVEKIETCIIAASFTKESEGKINCVSFPFIDEALCFGNTKCYHDGYDMTRQDKINLIADYGKKNKIDMMLRVCFSPQKGQNCNYCEKCMRTIMALTVANVVPDNYGFKVNPDVYAYIHEYLSTHLLYHTAHWKAIRAEFQKDKKKWMHNTDVAWILNFKFNSFKIYWMLLINKIKRAVGNRG